MPTNIFWPPRGKRRILGLMSSAWMIALVACSWLSAAQDALARPHLAQTEIGAKIEQLTADFRDADLMAKKGDLIREAIASGDFTVADRELGKISAEGDPKAWATSTLTAALDGFWLNGDSNYSARLAAWIVSDAKNPWPLLLQARLDYRWAWSVRGGGFANSVDKTAMLDFERTIQRGLAEVDAAIKLDDRDPYPYLLKLRLLQSKGASADLEAAFEQAVSKFPDSLPLYEIMLTSLEPKWGGSVEAMYAFTDYFAAAADKNSPLKLLYLNLYGDLIDTAGAECSGLRGDPPKMQACVDGQMQRIVKRGLDVHVVEALNLSDRVDRAQYSSWLNHLLTPMISCSCASKAAAEVLELAARSLHSQTEIKADPDHNNNYAIDHAVARSWSTQGQNEFAEQKDLAAVEDLKKAAFLTPIAKAKELASVYLSLSWTYGKLERYPEMIAYESAALRLDGSNDSLYTVCKGYFDMQMYDEVVRACSGATMFEQTPYARYYRGRAYFEMGKFDDALRDMMGVADMWSDVRPSAAVFASAILLSEKKDYQGAIDFLNKYKYLYDPKVSKGMDTASAYNNLCYGYMQLGRDQEALDNCTNSLKFASLPDAYAKQLVLVARLATTPSDRKTELK